MSFFNFKKKKSPLGAMLTIPEEAYSYLRMKSPESGKPLSVIVNTSLVDFQYRPFFGWQCVVWIEYDEDGTSGQPIDPDEFDCLNHFFDRLDAMLKADSDHPNALFHVRITGDGMAECVWMLNDPDKASDALDDLIHSGDHEMQFQYKIEQDRNWEQYSYFLDPDNVIGDK